jgi:hypothetical protein
VKNSTSRSTGTSKFRMVIIDAELQEGEIGQLAHAIQGAFGLHRAPAVRPNGSSALRSLPTPERTSELGDIAVELEDDEPADAAPTPTRAKQKAPRKIRSPALDPDLHPQEEPSFKTYAEARHVIASTSVLKKFLTVAAWLHEERDGLKITADRAFTCFRFIGWPFNFDFDQPLRNLSRPKVQKLEMKPEDKGKGEFTVTHLGLDQAAKMKAVQ